jgi:hypothetical protein
MSTEPEAVLVCWLHGDSSAQYLYLVWSLAPLVVQESLMSMKGQWQAELAALKSETERRRRLASYALKSRQEEEDIKSLEFQSQQKLWALEQEQLAAAAKSNLQDMAATAAAALAAKQRSKAEEWAAEDRSASLLA